MDKMNTKISIEVAIKILNSNKDFLFFSVNKYNNIEEYLITNDYHRYKNKYDKFLSIEKAKNIQINLVD